MGPYVTILVRGFRLQTSDSDVYRRQILTSKVDPRTVRVNDDDQECSQISFNYTQITLIIVKLYELYSYVVILIHKAGSPVQWLKSPALKV